MSEEKHGPTCQDILSFCRLCHTTKACVLTHLLAKLLTLVVLSMIFNQEQFSFENDRYQEEKKKAIGTRTFPEGEITCQMLFCFLRSDLLGVCHAKFYFIKAIHIANKRATSITNSIPTRAHWSLCPFDKRWVVSLLPHLLPFLMIMLFLTCSARAQELDN